MIRSKIWLAAAVVASFAIPAYEARADGKNEIRAVSFDDDGAVTRIHVRGAQTPTFTVYKLERPTRVVIDVPQARLAEAVRGHESSATFAASTWAVSTITAQQLDDGGQVVRVIVALARPGRYDVKTDGNEVVVMVTARDPAPKTANPAELAKLQAESDQAKKSVAAAQADAQKARDEADRLRKTAADQAARAEAAQKAVDDAKRAGQAASAADIARANAAAEAAKREAANAKTQAAAAASRAQQAQDAAESARVVAENAKRDALADAAKARKEAEAAKLETEAAKQQAARDTAAAKQQAARDADAAKQQAAREVEAAAKMRAEAEAAKTQAAKAAEAAKQAAAREADAAKKAAAQDLARSKAEAEAAKQDAARIKAEAAAAQAEAAKQLDAAARARAEADKAKREADTARAEAAATKDAAARSKADVDAARREAEAARSEAARTKAEADRQTELARAKAKDDSARSAAELEAARRDAAAARAEAARARTDAESARTAAAADKKQAETARAEADKMLRDARGQLAELDKKTQAAQAQEDKARAASAAATAREEAAREAVAKATRERDAAQADAKAAAQRAADATRQSSSNAAAMAAEARAAEQRLAAAKKAAEEADARRATAEKAAASAKTDLDQTRTSLATVVQQRTAAETAASDAARKRGEAEAAATDAARRRAEAESAVAEASKRKSEYEQAASAAQLQRKSAEDAARMAKAAADAAEQQRKIAEAATATAQSARAAAETSLGQLETKKQAAEKAAAELETRSKAEAKAQAEMAAAQARKAADAEIARARTEVARLEAERKKAELALADKRKAVATQQAETARLETAAAQARDSATREAARHAQLASKAKTPPGKPMIPAIGKITSAVVATAPAAKPTPVPTPAAKPTATLAAKPTAAAPDAKPVGITRGAPAKLGKINSISFNGSDGSGDVAIGVAGDASVALGEVTATHVELLVDNAELAARLERKLDVTRFNSPVRSVASFRDRRTPDRVRLIAELAQPSTPTVDRSCASPSGDAARPGGAGACRDGGMVHWRFVAQDVAKSAPRSTTTVAARTQTVPTPVVGGFGAASTPVAQQSVAQLPPQGNRRRVYRGATVDFDFNNAPIHDLLRIIADTGRVNIVVPDTIDAKVTVRLKRVPWDQALEVILASHGLWYRREGNLIRVAPRKELEQEDADEAARRKASVEAEVPRYEVVPLNYASADDMKAKLGGMLSPKGHIEVDERTNSLIVTDIAGNREQITRLALQLDTQTAQISIEARIVEARSTFTRQFGVQWGGHVAANAANGNATGLIFPSNVTLTGGNSDAATVVNGSVAPPTDFAINLPAATGSGEGGALGMVLGSIGGNVAINLRLSALEDTGTVRIISAPKVTVLDNKKASIKQGVSIPISVISAAGTQTQFVQADLSLEVTPHVTARDCSIAMLLKVEKNEPDFVNVGARGDPTILRKEATTSMLVSDGETSVLGGIYTRNSGLAYKKVPFFADIPVFGWFFKNRKENDDRTEILVFITPKITNKANLRCQ